MTEREYIDESERILARIKDAEARATRYEELAASPAEAGIKASHEAQARMARRRLKELQEELRFLDERHAMQAERG
jgi:hypothetical protein